MPKFVALAFALAAVLLLPAAANAKKPAPPPPPPPAPAPATSTYVRDYANAVGGVQFELTPEDVQATSDGGSIELGLAPSPSGSHPLVTWLLKADAVGTPQWQEDAGCFASPPGDYAAAVSVAQTGDGGYAVAGGTLGCGSGLSCPATSGIQCGLVERFDASGRLEWARVYAVGAYGTGFTRIATTSDGGFVVVGDATDASHDTGALILRLDALGNVVWDTELGPGSTAQAEFEAVAAAADGGFVATGDFYVPSGDTRLSLLVAKFDGTGRLTWRDAFAGTNVDGGLAADRGFSVVQTADGGFAVAGSWNATTFPGECCDGPLLLKLGAAGSLQWQRAYNGGVYCFDNGYSETCTSIGGVAYSVRQTADGGFLLAGESPIELFDEAPAVPWLAKTDGVGSLVWQESDYQSNPTTQRPLSQYFTAAAITPAGYLAAGATETPSNGLGQLFTVQSDTNGAVGACTQIHRNSRLAPIDPSLFAATPDLPVGAPTVVAADSPAQTVQTSTTATTGQC